MVELPKEVKSPFVLVIRAPPWREGLSTVEGGTYRPCGERVRFIMGLPSLPHGERGLLCVVLPIVPVERGRIS